MSEVTENERKGVAVADKERRIARIRDLVTADLEAGRLRAKLAYVRVVVDEFGVSRRRGYDDFEAVWDELRDSHDGAILKAQRRLLACLDDYVHELADLYEDCREAGERATALAALKEIARARDLLAPEKLDVTIKAAVDVNKLSLDEQRTLLDGIRKARITA